MKHEVGGHDHGMKKQRSSSTNQLKPDDSKEKFETLSVGMSQPLFAKLTKAGHCLAQATKKSVTLNSGLILFPLRRDADDWMINRQ